MIINANALQIPLADQSVHCIVTSPPYWGLRDYGTAKWEGGDPGCNHKPEVKSRITRERNGLTGGLDYMQAQEPNYHSACGKCGAIRIDNQLGLERTPEEYIANMVAVFRECWRVLRNDGTMWVNCGDSYASNGGGEPVQSINSKRNGGSDTLNSGKSRNVANGLKPKDLVGIPWLLAKALQQPFYTGKIPKEIDRVWMAATIDAEGTICGFYHIRKDDGRPRTGVNINITNSSMLMLEHAANIWPTNIHRHDTPGEGHLGTLDTFRWIINGNENKKLFLSEIYPYLVVKKCQALIAYNIMLFIDKAKHDGHTPQRDEIRDKRALLVQILSDLNNNKPVDLPSWIKEIPSLYEPGWYLRSDIIWSKPNPMPESVTDRPTKAHEYLFLLAKQERYYYDAEAIKEDFEESGIKRQMYGRNNSWGDTRLADPRDNRDKGPRYEANALDISAGRNRRTVWTIPTAPYKGAHFATFPPALVEPCIKAGTSERGVCPKCGKGWRRVVEIGYEKIGSSTVGGRGRFSANDNSGFTGKPVMRRNDTTLDWQPSCTCDAGEPIPALVFDPFVGSGTTVKVAYDLGRRGVGLDLSLNYLDEQARGRIHNGHTGRLL